MKKLLYILSAAAALVLAASCQKEAAREGDTVNATFRVALPEQVVTKAISDGTQATELIFRVFDKNNKPLPDLNQTVTVTDYHATINVQLVKGATYQFTFWAQKPGQYTVANDGTVTVTPKDMMNSEPHDAFYQVINNYLVKTPFTENVVLYRPFAQLNVGAPKDDFKAAASSAIDTTATVMKTAYTITVPNKLNLLDRTVSGAAEVEFTPANRPSEFLTVDGQKYSYVAMAYVLAAVDKELLSTVKFKISTKQNGADLELEREVANVPYQRNYRTNILGNIFSVTGTFNITVDPIYNEPDYDYRNTLTLAFYKGGEFKLEEDVVIDRPLVLSENLVLDLNGHTISNTTDIWDDTDGIDAWSLISVQGGTLTIKGNGKLDAKENDCYAIDVRDGGTLIIEDGEFIGNITAVYVLEGTADIRGGKFSIRQLSSQGDCRFTINLYDAARRDGNASAVISGGSFYKFNPGDNLAEGAGTNFLKDGCSATADGDWFNVE